MIHGTFDIYLSWLKQENDKKCTNLYMVFLFDQELGANVGTYYLLPANLFSDTNFTPGLKHTLKTVCMQNANCNN